MCHLMLPPLETRVVKHEIFRLVESLPPATEHLPTPSSRHVLKVKVHAHVYLSKESKIRSVLPNAVSKFVLVRQLQRYQSLVYKKRVKFSLKL